MRAQHEVRVHHVELVHVRARLDAERRVELLHEGHVRRHRELRLRVEVHDVVPVRREDDLRQKTEFATNGIGRSVAVAKSALAPPRVWRRAHLVNLLHREQDELEALVVVVGDLPAVVRAVHQQRRPALGVDAMETCSDFPLGQSSQVVEP